MNYGFYFVIMDNFLLYYKHHCLSLYTFFIIFSLFGYYIYIYIYIYIFFLSLFLFFSERFASFSFQNMLVMDSGLKVHFVQLNGIVPVKWLRVRINFSQIYFNFGFVVSVSIQIVFFLREVLRATERLEVVVEVGARETLEQLWIPSSAKHFCIKYNSSSLKS